ncbi:MAG: ABC transporter ATP-binding protein [Selenomonadaceae bacterium]|nr:ABC transporter ATP-binding protein [Selenomonadaceae bacterium]
MNELLRVKNLVVAYGQARVVSGVNFSVKRGEILVIAGESGSGKSTILKAIGGLLGKGGAILDGKIFFDGNEIIFLSDGQRRKISGEAIGFIFQNAGASFCPIRKIGEQIFESVRAHRDWDEKFFTARATELMKKINLAPEVLDEYPFRLSGGMAQRAGILAATILEPKLLLADEPTSALDVLTQAEVVKELLNLRARQKISIVLVTHDLRVAWRMADKILIMRRGAPVEFGTREQIFNAPRETYTRELIRAANLIRN